MDEARQRVLELDLPRRLLPNALAAHEYVQSQALQFISVLCYAQDGAAAVAQVAGAVERMARLSFTSSDFGVYYYAEKGLAGLLSKLVDATTAQAARDQGAEASFEPLLRLKADESDNDALKALVRSSKGRERARRALSNVLTTGTDLHTVASSG